MPVIKKVALIEPQPPGYHIYSRCALPRLGLPILGAILKRRGIEVSIHVQDFQPIDFSEVLSADLVGISTTTSTVPEAYRIAERVRQAGIPVVVGGPHVTFMADEALEYADFCVRGEGEYTFPELIDAIESSALRQNKDAGFGRAASDTGFGSILGLSYKIGGQVRHNSDRGLAADLDALPFPDLSLIRGWGKVSINPVITSRGCPYDCSFCSVTPMFGRACRHRSPESVVEELQQIEHGGVFFYDDNFAANRNRTKALLEMMISKGINRPWSAQVRAEVTRDRELMELFRKAHCWLVYVGFESASQETLQEFNKHQTVADMADAIRVFHEHDILVHGMFVLGAESDNARSIRETTAFALKHKIDTVQFMVLTPLPGTTYYHDLERQNRLLTRDWQLYDGHHVVYQPQRMSPYELQREAFRAMKRFYSVVECLRMLVGLDFVKFLGKLNWNLLLGRWHRAKWELRTRGRQWLYRVYGHVLIRRFEAANKERTKALAELTRGIRASLGSSSRESRG